MNQTVINSEGDLLIAGFLSILAQKIKLLTIIPLFATTITIIILLFFVDPVFTTTTKILPVSQNSSSTLNSIRGMASQFGLSIAGADENDLMSGELFPDIIKSRTIARNLLNREFYSNELGGEKSLLQIITYRNDEPDFGPDTLMKLGIEKLNEDNIKVVTSRLSPIVRITINAPEPKLSEELAYAVIEELEIFLNNNKLEKVRNKRQFIDDRSNVIKRELFNLEDQLKKFREQNRQISLSPSLLLQEEKLLRDIDVQKSVYITLKEQLELTKIQEVEETALIQVIDAPESPVEKSWPKRTQIVIIIGLLSIFLTIIFIYISNVWWDEHKRLMLKPAIENIKSIFK